MARLRQETHQSASSDIAGPQVPTPKEWHKMQHLQDFHRVFPRARPRIHQSPTKQRLVSILRSTAKEPAARVPWNCEQNCPGLGKKGRQFPNYKLEWLVG